MGSKSKVKKITDGVPVQVWFPKQVHEQIRSRAQTEQRTVPGTIRLVVEEWLEAKSSEPKSEVA